MLSTQNKGGVEYKLDNFYHILRLLVIDLVIKTGQIFSTYKLINDINNNKFRYYRLIKFHYFDIFN